MQNNRIFHLGHQFPMPIAYSKAEIICSAIATQLKTFLQVNSKRID